MALADNPSLKQVQEQVEKGKAWFYGLPDRDRLSIVVLVLFLCAVAIYYMVWSPIYDYLDKTQSRYYDRVEMLQWMKANESLAREASGAAAGGDSNRRGQSVLTLVNKTSGQHGISLKRVEPRGDDGLRMWLDSQPFDAIIGWLYQLNTQYGISVENLTFEKQPESGRVNATVILEG